MLIHMHLTLIYFYIYLNQMILAQLTCLCLWICASMAKQIVLVQQNDNFALKLDVGNLKVNLHAALSLKDKVSWIKSEQCKLCTQIQPQQKQKINDKSRIESVNNLNYQCSKSCFLKQDEQYGLKCLQNNKNCLIIKENVEFQLAQTLFKGKIIKIRVKDSINRQQIQNFQIVEVSRIYEKTRNDPTTTEQGEHQISMFVRKQIGVYSIWGDNSIFQSNVITKNNRKELQIYDGLAQNDLSKELLVQASPIQIQFEQTITQLMLSQVKFKGQITINHPQRSTEDHDFPILPLQNGFLSLQTQDLVLPEKHYNKITNYVALNYFSDSNNHCQFNKSTIVCQKSIQLDRIEYLQLELILNGISVNFPFLTLLKNCKSTTCQTKLSVSKSQKTFWIGTFILDIFAVQFVDTTENIKFHRLNNQWNKFYSKNQKYRKQNLNIFWWMASSVFYVIYYCVKVLFYLALFSLVVNCFYHWRKIVQWIAKILGKVGNRKGVKDQNQLFEEDQDLQAKDTSTLIKRFNHRMSKTFIQDQFIQTDGHSHEIAS